MAMLLMKGTGLAGSLMYSSNVLPSAAGAAVNESLPFAVKIKALVSCAFAGGHCS